MGKVSDLPNELLRYLFKMLSPEDRKMAVLVSRRWRKVGEDPVLWKLCTINIYNGNDIKKLSVGRFKYVEEIYVDPEFDWKYHQLEELFQATLELPKLKEINEVEMLDLRCVDSELLGKALGKLELLWLLFDYRTTNDQRFAILKEMSKKDCIKILRITRINLKTLELETGTLGKIISGLQSLDLQHVSLTSDQALEIFKSLSENNKLDTVKFSLNLSTTSSIESEMFGITMAKIDYVYLELMEILPNHARALFTEMGQNRGMKKFYALEINLSRVDPKLMARGLSKLEEIQLASNNLTDEQVRAIFTELKKNCKLKFLDFGSNNLSSVNVGDLASVVTNIKKVVMTDTQLSTVQITAVLTRAQQNNKLKRLDIRGNSISQVDPAILTSAREIMEELDIDSESEDEESDEDESLSGFSASENDTECENDTQSENDTKE